MEKRYYTPVELIKISSQHAHCADNLLIKNMNSEVTPYLFSVISLMYIAFELILKAHRLYYYGSIKQIKNLTELLESDQNLDLSQQEIDLLQTLAQQYAFRKGIDYNLWENEQQLHVFCSDLVNFYQNLQERIPIELQVEYQQEN